MTDQQINNYIRENYLTTPIKRIAHEIGRSQTLVRGRMKKLGIGIPPGLAEKRIKDSQFRKGATSHNKGKKIEEFMSPAGIEASKKTRFKKGQKPHNTKYNGHISIRESKGYHYAWIRTSEGVYELLHRVIWSQVHGDIPDGYNIQFRDGDSLNCDIDNLYIIHRTEQSVLNKHGGHKLPPYLQEAILLTHRLKKKINEKQNHRPK